MLSYLSQILSLEMKLYEMEEIRNQYCYQIQNLNNIVQKNLYDDKEKPEGKWETMILCGLAYGFFGFIGMFILMAILGSTTERGMLASSVVGIIVCIGVFIFWIYGNMQDKAAWRRNHAWVQDTNAQIQKNAQNANREIQLINSEINRLDSNYNMLLNTLDRLYNANVIYPKYRDLVAISSFYEYFSSGRCSQLQGHEGAYNIYENELMGRTIIGKLDDILYSLDSIRENQYLLYSELQRSNQTVNRLSNTINNAVSQLQDISRNQEVIAYNSEVTRKNTEVIKWISVCDYLNIR
ncbi:hypothetical protein B5F07_15205 [Lachnoclostridium sp. An169]|nr:hypothetical protein B5F07_15205 [Lachnoclostridium sp. An169]